MALETKLWKVGRRLTAVEPAPLESEDRLEDWLCQDIGMLDDDLLVIGRQVRGDDGTALDILAVDWEGSLVVIELKRGRTSRKVVAQALDYLSWVRWLNKEDVEEITQDHLGKSFDEAFQSAFDEEPPEKEYLNERQRVYIVASSIDPSTQRIFEYLSEVDVDINAVTFSYFNGDGGEFVVGPMFVGDEEGVATGVYADRDPSVFVEEGQKSISQRQGQGIRRKATNKQSVRVEAGHLVVEYEDGRKGKWELPEPGDKKAIRQIRQDAYAFARKCNATPGQLDAIGKELSSNGYRVRH